MKLNQQAKIFGGLTMALIVSICLFTSANPTEDAYAELVVEAEQCFQAEINGQCIEYCPPEYLPVVVRCK